MSSPAQSLTIKICGLSKPETLEAALAAGVEMIGLVFHPRSPRFVPPAEATKLAAMARGRAEIVALVVDRDIREIAEIVETVGPDWLQLHGRETPDTVLTIKAATGLRTIKALGVAERHDLAAFAGYEGAADRILLDAKPPKDAAYPGGHGRAFDWSILAALDRASPFMLSGGLDPANVAQAIAMARPWGVDVSSGVERAPGVKDIDRITDFVVAARTAAAAATEAGRI